MNMLIRFAILLNLLRQQQAEDKSINLERLKSPFSRHYRVLLHDMGFRNHLPNYRYLSFIELNITGWLYQILKQQGKGGLSLNWIISMQEMLYLKEVKFLEKLTVNSTLEGWDAKYLYFQHHFYVKNSLMAIGLTKVVLVNKNGKQSPQAIGLQGEQLTDVINTWNTNQTAIKSQ